MGCDPIGTCCEDDGTKWEVALCPTCISDPIKCLYGCCFPWCYVCYHRELILYGKMEEEYLCCQGLFGKVGKVLCCPNVMRKCPHCCLCLEIFFCVGCSIKGTRVWMKENYDNPKLKDNCVETCVGLLLIIMNILEIQFVTWFYGCLSAQHEREWMRVNGESSLALYCDWGNGTNQLFDVGNCAPCCGDPCDAAKGAYCGVCWTCCCPCSSAKMLATSQKQQCAIINHLIPYLLAPILCLMSPIPILGQAGFIALLMLNFAQRHNARVREGTGDMRYMCGDALLGNLCCPCSLCQVLRTYQKDDWDWLSAMQNGSTPTLIESLDFLRYSQ